MALSQDLRRRIVSLVASGVSRRAAARHFQVSASSAVRFVKQALDSRFKCTVEFIDECFCWGFVTEAFSRC